MTHRKHKFVRQAADKLAAGAVLAGALALLVWGGSGKQPRARVSSFSVAPPAPVSPRPAAIAAAVVAALPAPLAATRPRAAEPSVAPPVTFANATVCAGVRLVDSSGQGAGATVWLGDPQGIEQLELGQRFRDFVLLEVQPESEQSPALALLRGPNGTCRTARKREALDTMLSQIASTPPSVPAQDPPPTFALTPALAKQLVAALNLPPSANAGQ